MAQAEKVVREKKPLKQVVPEATIDGLRMKKGTPILKHLNTFNMTILFNSLSSFYEHPVTIILYEKETLVREDVTTTLPIGRNKEETTPQRRE